MKKSVKQVEKTIFELEIDEINKVVQNCLDEGIPAVEIINGMGSGMTKVGEKFEAGDYYLAELVLSGDIMKEGMKLLEDKLDEGQVRNKGTVVLATAKGDIHDIGKDIVGTMLSAAGFKVIDLGVDCHEDTIIETVKSSGSHMIALSVLLTTMVGSIKDLINVLIREGIRDQVKVAIGGACCSQAMVDKMGVDAFGEDAVKAVGIFENFLKG